MLSALTQGTNLVGEDVRAPRQLEKRIPFSLTEAIFVVCYFAAAEKDWPKWVLDLALSIREWALVVFVVHPSVWRLLPKTIAFVALLASPLPFYLYHQKDLKQRDGMTVLP